MKRKVLSILLEGIVIIDETPAVGINAGGVRLLAWAV